MSGLQGSALTDGVQTEIARNLPSLHPKFRTVYARAKDLSALLGFSLLCRCLLRWLLGGFLGPFPYGRNVIAHRLRYAYAMRFRAALCAPSPSCAGSAPDSPSWPNQTSANALTPFPRPGVLDNLPAGMDMAGRRPQVWVHRYALRIQAAE
jgi:hypothetical protein